MIQAPLARMDQRAGWGHQEKQVPPALMDSPGTGDSPANLDPQARQDLQGHQEVMVALAREECLEIQGSQVSHYYY